MALDKLSIRVGTADPLKVMFNPNSYTISKAVSWVPAVPDPKTCLASDRKTNAPSLTFGGGGSRQLSLELFFDVTASGDQQPDVRKKTDPIVQLTRIDRSRGDPPVCTIEWGGSSADFPFYGTVSNLTQRFVLFHESGRPLRAILTITFIESLNLNDDQRKTDPELTTRVVRRGDTLASIAADVYLDPTQWRLIATTNRIEDPFKVFPGTKLVLPKV
jgi:hypothetical protein